jgi:amino acid adenylation domain-containing protein
MRSFALNTPSTENSSQRTACPIVARIADVAASLPDKAAVVDAKSRLTYAELDRRATRLASRLHEIGARADRCVGVWLERSNEFIVAILGVFKSGAAYVPIDPSTPRERIAFMLGDAGAIAVVTDGSRAADAPTGRWSVIDVAERAGADSVEPPAVNDPNSLAYVIYTSGSTGQPKGVEITHASLCNLVDWHQRAFRVTAEDSASQVAGLGFDASAWEIWPYLTAGATLHVAGEETRRDASALREWMLGKRITIGFVPTLLAEQLLRMEWPSDTALRTLLTGGDALHRRPPNGLPFTVVNNYGPTECTVVTTSGTIAPSADASDAPSIGRPIENTIVLILDDALRPVEAGETGELCVGGAPVGRGYRDLPELTESRFVQYISASGERLRIYRTGDRARVRSNGEIEFLGRLDDQVKVRGNRIELAEISANLNRHPGVESSAVTVTAAGDSEALVAYVVPAPDARLTTTELREFLAERLPDYMLPDEFVRMSAVPLTASGKLDKAVLPSPSDANRLQDRLDANGGAAEEMQTRIAALVASLLEQPSVGYDDNFFLIGGHSMLGVQLVAQIRDTFGVTLTLRQLFTAPTVTALSSEIARVRAPAR